MGLVLSILALILVIWGVVTLLHGAIIFGIILLVVGLALGSAGGGTFNRRL